MEKFSGYLPQSGGRQSIALPPHYWKKVVTKVAVNPEKTISESISEQTGGFLKISISWRRPYGTSSFPVYPLGSENRRKFTLTSCEYTL